MWIVHAGRRRRYRTCYFRSHWQNDRRQMMTNSTAVRRPLDQRRPATETAANSRRRCLSIGRAVKSGRTAGPYWTAFLAATKSTAVRGDGALSSASIDTSRCVPAATIDPVYTQHVVGHPAVLTYNQNGTLHARMMPRPRLATEITQGDNSVAAL